MTRRRVLPRISHERWLISYADFITLLFAFFVVLYASSKADQRKQLQFSQAIDSAFHSLGMFPGTSKTPVSSKGASEISRDEPVSPMTIVMGEEVMAPVKVKEDLEQVRKYLQKMLANEIAEHTVSVEMGKDGLVISLREAGFFNSGSATPHPETLPVLRQIAGALGKTAYNVRIEGHTDTVPIHNGEFDSNWELSSARATRMARIFVETKAIPPGRIGAAGYAEFHPVASNDSASGRAENRRVDLVVLPTTTTDLSSPWGDISKGTWRRITDD
jgi:chemotaxis protein MotB